MKNIIHNLYLPVLCYLISYSSVNGQKTYNDSIHIIKKNYIDITIGGDPNKESLLKQLSTIPPEKEVSDQNIIELQQFYPFPPKR
ncbi:hypothetical protein [Bacteroides fragilis]|uniref:hypothetical protein n=1 Tax=Bacteroides fragilis TaxID=817 RepID=UPI00216A5AA2|nr:hypothetical protein [Bacteroides fragilis]